MTVLVSTHYMDEAERCDELAFISYGKLLAQGTAADLIAQAGGQTLEDAFVALIAASTDNFS